MKPAILLQLDADPQPSVFDAVVALDAGADHLLRHGGVSASQVEGLVHGLLFTRGPDDLKRSAIFVGGGDVSRAEALVAAVRSTFFGPFRVSILMDANGCNTTAAAAVLAAIEGAGGDLRGRRAAVLGATGPVGRRVARLLRGQGASVALGSRQVGRAEALAASLGEGYSGFGTGDHASIVGGLRGATVVVAAGAAGARLLSQGILDESNQVETLIDLNAVPPSGIEGVEATDKGTTRDDRRCWGALGVGGTKMKIHKAAIRALFEANDRVLDAEEVLEIGRSLT